MDSEVIKTHIKMKKNILLTLLSLIISISSYAQAKETVITAGDFNKYMTQAKEGDSEAMRCLAICYQKGLGTNQNYKEMFNWLGKSAQMGNVEAEYDLGVIYRDGIGIKQNPEDAAYWFRKAARNGHTDAMVNIGRFFEQGYGVLPDLRIASEYYWRAGSRGNIEGKYAYAVCLRDGKGVEKNPRKALKWFEECAEQNYKDSALQVSELKKTAGSAPSEFKWKRKRTKK